MRRDARPRPNVIPLEAMTRPQLEEIAIRLENRADGDPSPIETMAPGDLVAYIESLKRPSAARPKKTRQKRPRMPKNRGVGKYCRELVMRVVATGPDGPIGLSYNKMTKMVRRKFPDSAADERHLRWYAAQLRREDKRVPNNRERSRWI